MSKADPTEAEEKLIHYFYRIKVISFLQSKLSLFMKNKEIVQQSIEDCNLQDRNSDLKFEKLQRELKSLDAEILSIGALIRSGQREIIYIHNVVERLPEDDKKLIALLYQEKLSLAKAGEIINLSTSSVFHRKERIIRDITSLLGR